MKRGLTAILICFFGMSAFSQNSVPNPGFEINSGLPFTVGQWNLVNEWTNAGSTTGSPDYFHHAGTLGGDLPETPIGNVSAFSGEGVMGFAAAGVKGTDYREYISVQLTEPMVPGATYLISFWVTNGQVSQASSAGLATTHMGIHLNTVPDVQVMNQPLMVTPQAEMNGMLYSDIWRFLGFTVVADQAYEYLTIGVFGDDDDKSIDPVAGVNPTLAYYFFDDFSVTETDPEPTEHEAGHGERPGTVDAEEPEIIEVGHIRHPVTSYEMDDELVEDFYVPNAFTPDNDGINDAFEPHCSKGIPYSLSIFNRWGELIYKTSESGEAWDGQIDGKRSPSGVYLWQLTYEKAQADGSKQENILEGTVQLIR